jgi:hypothetical protein
MGADERAREALRRRVWGRWWSLGLLFTVVACSGDGCGGGGCDSGCGGGGCASTPYPEEAPAVRNGAQVRVSSHGFDFFEENAAPLVDQLVDGGLTFCLPAGTDPVTLCNVRTCPSTQETGCEISVQIDGLEIDPVAPDVVRATITIGGLDQETDFIEVNLLSNCIVRLGTRDNAGLPATVEAKFLVDPVTEDVTIDLDPESIEIDFDRLDIDIDGATFFDLLICESVDFLASLGFVRDLLFEQVTAPLVGAIGGFTEPLLCMQCETDGDCANGSQCVVSENDEELMICFNDDTGRCVPNPLGIEDVMDMGALLAGVSPGLEAELAYQFKLFGYAEVQGEGLSLGMRAGTYGDKSQCVPAVPPPEELEAPRSQVLSGNEDPDGEPFHIGIGLHEYFLNEALWGVYQSGALCLTVGTETVALLSTSTFATLLPSLRELTGPGNAPLFLQMAPQQPPTAKVGAGTIDPDSGDLIDPLLTLEWDNLDIHFYAFFHERFVRVFTINADLVIPLGLDVTDEGIIPVLGDFSQAFARVEVRNAEILTEDPAFLEGLLPSLVGIALPLLGDSLSSPIALPEFSGFALELGPRSLRGIENNTMLGIFANLAIPDNGQMDMLPPRLDTRAALVDLSLPPEELARPMEGVSEAERVERLFAQRPVATVEVSSHLWGAITSRGEAQFSYRLNHGFWTPWRTDPNLEISDPILLLQGQHSLEVRSRFVGMPATMDASPAVVTINVDFERPRLQIENDRGVFAFVGHDAVTGPGVLEFSWRVHEGGAPTAWSPWSTVERLDSAGLAESDRVDLEVRVRDQAGHQAVVRREFAVHGRVERATDGTGCECNTPASTARSWAPLVGVAGLFLGALFLRRSRRQWRPRLRTVWLMLAVGMLFIVAGCEDSKYGSAARTIPCDDDLDCPAGQFCVDGACGEREGCTEDGDCPGGEVCRDGECVDGPCESADDCAGLDCGATEPVCLDGVCACAEPCADGCAEAEFCCEVENACQAIPDPCAEQECDPGFAPEVVSESTGNPDTCEVSAGECECAELDPLREGQIGRYVDAVVVDGAVVVVAYNDTYGDLMVGRLGDADAWTWTFVDGLPTDAPVIGKIDGPRGGVGAPGDKVGRFSSVAVGANGTLHVAYHDDTNGALKYARGTPAGDGWTWDIHVVDPEGAAGYWSDLTLSAEGVPAVAYMAPTVPAPELAPEATGVLRWAAAATAEPSEGGDWSITDLDGKTFEYWCGGGCRSGQKCRRDTNTCERTLGAARCDDACVAEQACFEDGCVDVAPPPAAVGLPEGVGLFARTARFADGRVAIVYYDRSGSDLRYLEQTVDGWSDPVILAGRDSEGNDIGDAGQFCDIAIGTEDDVHITFVDAVRDDLRYIQLGADLNEIVDDGVRITANGGSTGLVGDDSALVLTPDGPRVAYMDSTGHDLILALRSDNGWEALTMAGNTDPYVGSFGFYTRHLWMDGTSVIVSFRYNRQADPPQVGLVVHRF